MEMVLFPFSHLTLKHNVCACFIVSYTVDLLWLCHIVHRGNNGQRPKNTANVLTIQTFQHVEFETNG